MRWQPAGHKSSLAPSALCGADVGREHLWNVPFTAAQFRVRVNTKPYPAGRGQEECGAEKSGSCWDVRIHADLQVCPEGNNRASHGEC